MHKLKLKRKQEVVVSQPTDMLQEKLILLGEYSSKSHRAVELVENAITDLNAVNKEIEATVDEISKYIDGLNTTKDGLIKNMQRNSKVASNFKSMLEMEE